MNEVVNCSTLNCDLSANLFTKSNASAPCLTPPVTDASESLKSSKLEPTFAIPLKATAPPKVINAPFRLNTAFLIEASPPLTAVSYTHLTLPTKRIV